MKIEQLNELKKLHEKGIPLTASEVEELFAEIDRLRENFQWIKNMENDFYSDVRETEFGEIRSLNKILLGYSGQFQSLFGAANEALTPKYDFYA